MEYKVTLLAETLAALLDPLLEIDEKANLLKDELDEELENLGALLEPYRSDKLRGTILADTIKFDGDGLTLESAERGTVSLRFEEDAYYGCKNMDGGDEHWGIEIPFSILHDRGILVLRGIDEPEREPDGF